MTARTSAGTTLYVCASAPATYDVSGYAALTWVSVGEVTGVPDFGREYTLVTHVPIASRITQKYKGSYNEGSGDLQLALDTDDAGQIVMKAASLSDSSYFFRITTQNGDVYYAPAKVMSWKVGGLDSADNITKATAKLEWTSSSAGVGFVESLAA